MGTDPGKDHQYGQPVPSGVPGCAERAERREEADRCPSLPKWTPGDIKQQGCDCQRGAVRQMYDKKTAAAVLLGILLSAGSLLGCGSEQADSREADKSVSDTAAGG